ncbi:MAG: hypothetical protein Q7U36_00445 [bacterium]|nr:hypothetical protein [bacterium]
MISSISNQKEEIAEKFNNYESKVKDIEREINNEKVDVSNREEILAKAMGMLEELFGSYVTNDNYRKIKTELGYKIR